MTVTWMDIDNSVRSVQVIDSKSLEPGNPPSAQRARNLSKWFDSFLHMLEAPEQ